MGETFKILILSFEKKHISSMFWVIWNLVYCRYMRCIREFATGLPVILCYRAFTEYSLNIQWRQVIIARKIGLITNEMYNLLLLKRSIQYLQLHMWNSREVRLPKSASLCCTTEPIKIYINYQIISQLLEQKSFIYVHT